MRDRDARAHSGERRRWADRRPRSLSDRHQARTATLSSALPWATLALSNEARETPGFSDGSIVALTATLLPRELLERVAIGWNQASLAGERVRDLGDVDVSFRIGADVVGSAEAARCAAIAASPASQHLPIQIVDAHSPGLILLYHAPGKGALTGAPPQLGGVDEPVPVDVDVRRSLDVGPLTKKFAVRTEDLNAIIFPVGHEHPPIRRHPDSMGQVKAARPAAGLPP
jgi:hypothetical protein